jgi:PAS domain S-box-containing protein
MRVLLIDEHTESRETITRRLQRDPHTIEWVEIEDRESYHQVLDDGQFDLVLTEQVLSWTDGLSVLRDVQRRMPGVPVMMVTGAGSETLAVDGLKAGLTDYIPKANLERLAQAVQSLAARDDLPDGSLDAPLSSVRDNLRLQEQALHKSEGRYRTLFESMNEGFAVGKMLYDQNGAPCDYRFTEVNAAYERLTGLSRKASLEKTIRQLIPSLEPQWITYHARVVETGEPLRWESYNAQTDKTFEIYTYRPEPGLFASIFSDITERKQWEEALRQSEKTARTQLAEIESIYRSAHIGLCVFDEDLRFVRINDHMAEINGVPAAEHIGRTPREVVPDLAEAAEALHRQIFMTGEAIKNIEIVGMTPAQPGRLRTWIEHWLPLKNGAGQVVRINVVAEEITERKQAEEQLQHYAAELEQLNETNRLLLREVNHRVKNNLTVIMALIGAERNELRRKMDGDGEPTPYLAALEDLSERVRSLATLHGLLSSGGWQPVSVCELAGSVIRALVFGGEVAQPGEDLRIEGPPVLITPEQAHHLALVIGELATNTLKYGRSADGMHIVVDVAVEDGDVRIVYRSRGPAYPEHVLRGQGHSVGLGLVHKLTTHSLRGTWSLRNEDGAVTEIRFPIPDAGSED